MQILHKVVILLDFICMFLVHLRGTRSEQNCKIIVFILIYAKCYITYLLSRIWYKVNVIYVIFISSTRDQIRKIVACHVLQLKTKITAVSFVV